MILRCHYLNLIATYLIQRSTFPQKLKTVPRLRPSPPSQPSGFVAQSPCPRGSKERQKRKYLCSLDRFRHQTLIFKHVISVKKQKTLVEIFVQNYTICWNHVIMFDMFSKLYLYLYVADDLCLCVQRKPNYSTYPVTCAWNLLAKVTKSIREMVIVIVRTV